MGLQQALGLIFLEIVDALYAEAVDVFKNGFKTNDESFFKELKTRFNRVASRILNKRKEIVVAFGEGALSGFISNLITTLINMIYTTSTKAIRAIREGFFSIFKALKIMTNPPPGLTLKEACHEASKLIATGAVVSIGILLDEVIEKLIISTPIIGPLLTPFAKVLSEVTSGILIGVTSALVVYLIDRIDIFKVNKDKLYSQLSTVLDGMVDSSKGEINEKYGHLTTVELE